MLSPSKSSSLLPVPDRLTLILSCPMDLKNFPMDIQTCTMQLESCKCPWSITEGGLRYQLVNPIP